MFQTLTGMPNQINIILIEQSLLARNYRHS